MDIMTHAKFYFNRLMLTLICAIRASEPPRAWRTTEKAGPDRVKSLIASKPVYLATMKHLPQEILDDLQSIHKDFIWDRKRAKIKHCTLTGNYTDGGLQDVDLVSKFTSLKFI